VYIIKSTKKSAPRRERPFQPVKSTTSIPPASAAARSVCVHNTESRNPARWWIATIRRERPQV